MDDYDIESLINPDHQKRALEFEAFVNYSKLLDGQTPADFFTNHQLGFGCVRKPVVGNKNARPPRTSESKKIALEQAKREIRSAYSTIIVMQVSFGNLFKSEETLEEDFRSNADKADNFISLVRKLPDFKEEMLKGIETGDQMYEEAWEEHRKRIKYLTSEKIEELKKSAWDMINSKVFLDKLRMLGGRITKINFQSTPGAMLKVEFTFE